VKGKYTYLNSIFRKETHLLVRKLKQTWMLQCQQRRNQQKLKLHWSLPHCQEGEHQRLKFSWVCRRYFRAGWPTFYDFLWKL